MASSFQRESRLTERSQEVIQVGFPVRRDPLPPAGPALRELGGEDARIVGDQVILEKIRITERLRLFNVVHMVVRLARGAPGRAAVVTEKLSGVRKSLPVHSGEEDRWEETSPYEVTGLGCQKVFF